MVSVGLMLSSIYRMPSFAKTKRLTIEKNWVWKALQRLAQSPNLYVLLRLLASSH